jgi:hypothetical protein
MTSDGERDDGSGTADERGGSQKHSKRAGEPDPGLDPEPYESSRPSQEAVQRGGVEERDLESVGEGVTGDGVEGAQAAGEDGSLPATGRDGERAGDHVDVELVDQPDQPNMGPPQTAPAPRVPRAKQ